MVKIIYCLIVVDNLYKNFLRLLPSPYRGWVKNG